MKIFRTIAFLFVMVFMACPALMADSYEKLWKQAKELNEKNLTRSAYDVALKIYEKAVADNEKGQMLASLLYSYSLQQIIVPDSFYVNVPKIERLKENADDPVFQAVCASVLAYLYADKTHNVSNMSTGRKAHPDSLREWSREQYREAVLENASLSMAHPELLRQTKAADYLPLVVEGKDADLFNGDLLNVILRQAISSVNVWIWDGLERQLQEWYGSALDIYRQAGMREAELMLMLDSVDAVSSEDSYARWLVDESSLTLKERERRVLESPRCRAYFYLLSRFSDLPQSVKVYEQMLRLTDVTQGRKMKWAQEACARYASSPYLLQIRNWMADAVSPKITWTLQQQRLFYPSRKVAAALQHRNVPSAEIIWYELPEDVDVDAVEDMDRAQALSYFKKKGRRVKSQYLTWPSAPDYELVDDTVYIETPDIGYYGVVMIPAGVTKTEDMLYSTVAVSRLKLVAGAHSFGDLYYRVVDAESGRPVEGAQLQLFVYDKGVKKYIGHHTADRMGTVHVSMKDGMKETNNRCYAIVTDGEKDRYLTPLSVWIPAQQKEVADYEETRLYTDRAIYRPGQTVYVGGILSRRTGDSDCAIADRTVTLRLLDANGKVVTERQAVTDEMGTLNQSFVIPASGLPGFYSVRTGNNAGAVSFRVDNYRRPTFELVVDAVEKTYSLGDTVVLTGSVKTYTGVPVKQARITAEGTLRAWWRMVPDEYTAMRLDTVFTDEAGRFSLPVVMPDLGAERMPLGLYYRCNVNATDQAGETHDAVCIVPLGKQRMTVNIDAPTMWECHSGNTFTTTVQVDGGTFRKDAVTLRYSLYRILAPKTSMPVYKDEAIKEGRPVSLKVPDDLTSGKYELRVCAISDGDTAFAVHPFVYFDLNAAKPVSDTAFWYYSTGDTLRGDRPLKVQVGSSMDTVFLYYMLFTKDRVLQDTMYCFSDSLLTFNFEPQEAYGDGAMACFMFVKDDCLYQRNQPLVVEQPDRRLRMAWSSFRDRLKPGEEETWSLRILLPDGRPAPAQLMATLYDASLEQFAAHDWFLSFDRPATLPFYSLVTTAAQTRRLIYQPPVQKKTVYTWEFDHFDKQLYPLTSRVELYGRISGLSLNGLYVLRSPKTVAAGADMAVKEESVRENETLVTEETVKPVVGLRENFNETAFFYPALSADKDGYVKMTFTLPESLTSWNFIGLAHTADMMSGTLRDEITAHKDVMVQLGLPRFVRKGDHAGLTATLFNRSDRRLKTRVTMEVFNPVTEKVLWKESCRMRIEAQEDSVIAFNYVADDETALLACRVVAEAGDFTDGEQRYLPVLEDKVWVTETLPFDVDKAGETTVDAGRLFQNNNPEAGDRRLTVEYAGNPLWYAVQAMPSLLRPATENALDLAAAYYATTVVGKLSAAYPEMKATLGQWTAAGNEEGLGVSADKEDLTGLLMEETPWAVEAENERQQIAGLGELFDSNRLSAKTEDICSRLAHLQYADGSFSWFNGMKGSLGMTLRVAEWLARAGALENGNATCGQVDLEKMMRYIARHVQGAVKREREQEYKDNGAAWLSCMYILGCSHESYSNLVNAADLRYMLERIEAGCDRMSQPDRARAAWILFKNGKRQKAGELVAALREHLVASTEGLHLEYPSGGRYSSDEKIARHVQLMETFAATDADAETMQALAKWLLSQKRVQAWPTSAATAEAVFAMLSVRGEALDAKPQDEIWVTDSKGNEVCALKTSDSKLAGLGYVKAVTESEPELKNGVSAIHVSHKTDGVQAWGAAYAQFTLPIASVEEQASGMQVRCEWPQENCRVGDRITAHIVITADRDYDYVSLKLGRAACMEPVDALSGYRYRNGLGYYQAVGDASTTLYLDILPKGTYVLEVEYYVERPGEYQCGISTLTCVYAPEFTARSSAQEIVVEP